MPIGGHVVLCGTLGIGGPARDEPAHRLIRAGGGCRRRSPRRWRPSGSSARPDVHGRPAPHDTETGLVGLSTHELSRNAPGDRDRPQRSRTTGTPTSTRNSFRPRRSGVRRRHNEELVGLVRGARAW